MKRITALTLSIALTAPLLAAPAIFLAGDSTVQDYGPKQAPLNGWGQALREFCKPEVQVHNRAAGGRSTKTFRTEGRWDKLLNDLSAGDTVFIQFGHNDQKSNQLDRYAPAETDYKTNLEAFIQEVRAKGAHAILCTPVNRRLFRADGSFNRSLAGYPQAAREVAAATHTPLIDLNAFTEKLFTEAGPEGSKKYFNFGAPGELANFPDGVADNSHFNSTGAAAVAAEVVRSCKEQKLPVAELFR